ncbi:MAG: ferrochelatase [Flavobacteriales bacterium]|nr:ferrochelatase [Flavobacteriales bacterium]
MIKKGILLVNLGTPDSPSVKDVRKYLREFLMDKRVIDLPFLTRWLLINLIIVPFRGPKSAAIYKQLWTKKGSPLLYHGIELKDNLQKLLGINYHVAFAMRYQKPSIKSALEELKRGNVSAIKVIPLYPQYASSSTGSTIAKIMEIVKKDISVPPISFVSSFCDLPELTNAFASNGKKHLDRENFDHILFSYHGLPERHLKKGDSNNHCFGSDTCCQELTEKNQLCYRAQCFETTKHIVKKLGLKDSEYTIAFQSRLETRAKDPWIKPYSDIVLTGLAKKGVKKVLVFSPAFVADCLETTVEIGIEYQELFEENGGEKIQLVESLNGNADWLLPLCK